MRRKLLDGKMMVVVAVFLMLFTAVGIAEEERTDASGQWKYVLSNGGATIVRNVERSLSGEVVIPNELDGFPVTGIGDLFLLNERLTGVMIPEGVTSIGNSAFFKCRSLTSITIPDSVTNIGSSAFEGSGLTSIVLPDSVTDIGLQAFALCADLVSVTIPNGVTHIRYATFAYDHRLASVTIPDSVTIIGERAFHQCDGLTSVIISDNVTSIEERAFDGCTSLTALAIPPSVTSIGESAFNDCVNLTLEVFEGSYGALYARSNDIPFVVVGVVEGEGAIDSKLWKYALEDGGAIIESYTKKPIGDLSIPSEIDGHAVIGISGRAFEKLNITSVIIPDGVTSIGDYAFFECPWLSKVTIPASVVRMGLSPFARCGLKNIRVSSENPTYADTKGVLFDKDQKMLIAYPGDKTGKYVIPKGTLSIGDSAFEWSVSLTGVTIPGSVADIGARAFYMCQELTAVTISKGVERIGDSAFYDCRKLKKVTIPGSAKSIGDNAFFACERLKTVTLQKGVEEIGDGAFQHCVALTKVTIPDSVMYIGDNAFLGCESLKSLSIPDSVTSIGEDAFDNFYNDLTISVTNGSYAEQYAKDNGIPYVLAKK